MRQRIALLLILLVTAAGLDLPVRAAYAQSGVVHAVLFYSPTCAHCQAVMANDLPPLEQRYGEQLSILYVNVIETNGQAAYRAAIQQFGVPEERRGVPMLVVGNTVMVGGDEIPAQFPGLIDTLLAQGGIDWPPIPGFDMNAGTTISPEGPATIEPAWTPTFPANPLDASLLVVTLIGMVLTIGYVGITWPNRPADPPAWHTWAILGITLFALCVAGYLAYLETTLSPSFCPIGNCDKVQASPYARLFGVIPIGWIGVAGSIALLVTWLGGRLPDERLRNLSTAATFGGALFGTLFATYLTYLETFVIGELCIWCLSVAISMTALLWLSIAPGKRALVNLGWRREYVRNANRKRRRSRRSVARQRS